MNFRSFVFLLFFSFRDFFIFFLSRCRYVGVECDRAAVFFDGFVVFYVRNPQSDFDR